MYKLINGLDGNLECILSSNNTLIPINELNTDYQTYLKWLDGYEQVGREWVKTAEFNTPEPAEEQA